ncbi:hypothetical protein H4P12_15665 [Paracoccus sp. 11-3]|uniref:Uncharacterized protein n=1 Tax=Paracoccus amoyensis TaxID=2760093 RepID=A0A926GIZ9_9RHOB|nr:hypothetical protein [Paracoccus amoyensis]MBC9248114.1 hypothetical protein [Paracoccus amoyensis]
MKRIAIAMTALALTAGSVAVAQASDTADRMPHQVTAEQTVTVDAARVMSARELSRAGVDAAAQVTVTDFSNGKPVDTYTR